MDPETSTIITAGGGSLLRHALTSLGGSLATAGILNANGVAEFVGAGMTLAGVVWAIWQKAGQAAMQKEIDWLRGRLQARQQSVSQPKP